MIKFVHLNANADAEEIMDTVNRYLFLDMTRDLENFDAQLSEIIEAAARKMQNMENIYKIDENVPVQSNNKVKVLIKKIIRKMISWYVNIYPERQTEFNAKLLGSMNEQMEIIRGLYLRNMILSKQNEQLRLMIHATSKEGK